jgi:hypothetical protein
MQRWRRGWACWRLREARSLLAIGALEDRREVERLRRHLATCAPCRDEVSRLETLTFLARDAGAVWEGIGPDSRLTARWARRVRNDAKADDNEAFVGTRFGYGNRLAWGALGAMWLLVVFFKLTAPTAPDFDTAPRTVSWNTLRVVLRLNTEFAAESGGVTKPKGGDAVPRTGSGPRGDWQRDDGNGVAERRHL